METQLRKKLDEVASRQRRVRMWYRLAVCWAGAAVSGLLLLLFQAGTGRPLPIALPCIALLAVLAALIAIVRRTGEPDWREIARLVEGRFPELEGRLLTAAQQDPKKKHGLNYLQERVVDEALVHSRQVDWRAAVPVSRLRTAQMLHGLALLAFAATLAGLTPEARHRLFMASSGTGLVSVTPGDISLEQGNTLVVLARFKGTLPAGVELVIKPAAGAEQRVGLVKSLADPMFGGSVAEVVTDLAYHIEYSGHRTRDFHVSVFEHPRLERADATVIFPDYTSLEPKRIENTRRVSAVEGSRLELALRLNKPVMSARLVAKDKDGTVIPLTLEAGRAMAALTNFPLQASKSYELRLTDAEGRTNKVQSEFVFNVLSNRRPEIRLVCPRGDLRPSPLEEISFDGTIWDDFGVKAFGLGYSLVGQETKFTELGKAIPGQEKRPFHHVLRLEELGLQPDDLISWFVWADDIGPDGQTRRTMGDLYFAEVRAFEEVFREGQGMDGGDAAGGAGGGGSPSGTLAELEKQIISATWNLQHKSQDQTNKPNQERKTSPPRDSSSSITSPPADLAQIFNLLHGRFAIGKLSTTAERWHFPAVADCKSAIQQIENPRYFSAPDSSYALLAPARAKRAISVFGQSAKGAEQDQAHTPEEPGPPLKKVPPASNPEVVRDAQEQALEQTHAAGGRQQDQRTAALWSAAAKEMEKALERLNRATQSPGSLAEALAAEQAAYQTLLKLQEHEYQVSRSRNRNQRGGSREQQMQRQLEQMDLTQSDERYETQRQAQAPQSEQRRQQLQMTSRLQELARRQQDLNERLQELQAALQEARTDQEREEIRRRLKRLEEEEQQMLSDIDELHQRMDQPENQSQMAQQRQQLEQTRQEVQRAADSASRGEASQALASGTRAQRQLQDLRDQMRKANSSQFADDLREMRRQARDLVQSQDELGKQLQAQQQRSGRPGTLSDSPERQSAQEKLGQQKQQLTNLVERATEVSKQSEETEPLLSQQLYDTVRKFAQDSARALKENQDNLLNHGLMSRGLYEQLKDSDAPDAAKMFDVTSDLLRRDLLPQAEESSKQLRAGLDQLKGGIEHAAESVLGDDTEALRLAREELNRLTDQLHQEMAQDEASQAQTNQAAGAVAAGGSSTNGAARGSRLAQGEAAEGTNIAQSSVENRRQSPSRDGSAGQEGPPAEGGNGQNQPGSRPAGLGRNGRPGNTRPGGAWADGGNGGGDLSGSLGRALTRSLDENASLAGPLTGDDFVPWVARLGEVEEMVDQTDLRNQLATARERARLLRRQYRTERKKPDWAVVQMQVLKPLVEVRDQIAQELARRQSREAIAPLDRDPVPNRYSELVRKYYEELGKDRK